MSWIFLAVGIICLVVLQTMRTVLGVVFVTIRARQVDAPSSRDVAGHDLYEGVASELAALGFERPVWIETESTPPDSSAIRYQAAFRNPVDNIVVWCTPPSELATPNEPMIYMMSALVDGQYAISQISDPYFEYVNDKLTPAQTIAPTDMADAIEQHKTFVAGLGISAQSGGTAIRQILHFGGEHQNGIRKRLLEEGRAREIGGLARPTITDAFRILIALFRRPKSKSKSTDTVPADRLAHLYKVMILASNRAPAQSMQWLLMLFSVVLSIAIGWPIFGMQFTVVIVGVIFFHEFGHWVAMRMAGYENPHITLLPLLGGVTIGHERDPSATKRAWVSLAGPLPGIVLGWAIVYQMAAEPVAGPFGQWLTVIATMLLIINYLNVLPIPPLDGSHVVRALLPPGWLAIHSLAVLGGVGLGVYVAYLLDFWALGLIAALQLFSIGGIWTDARAIRRFNRDRPPAQLDEEGRIHWILSRLEEQSGQPQNATERIAEAVSIHSQLDVRSMGWGQGSFVTIVFLAMAIVPIGGVALMSGALLDHRFSEEEQAHFDAIEPKREALMEQAATMSAEELLAGIVADGERRAPATDEQIRAAEERIGVEIPVQLTALLRISNGVSALGLGTIENLVLGRDNPELHEMLGAMTYEDALYLWTHAGDDLKISADELDHWITFRLDVDIYSSMMVAPDATTSIDGYSVIQMGEDGPYAYETIDALLTATWVSNIMGAEYAKIYSQRRDAKIETLDGVDIRTIVDEFEPPSLVDRFIWQEETWPVPASVGEIAMLEGRIGRPLPDDHRALLTLHNGFPPAFLLSTAEVRAVETMDEERLEQFMSPGYAEVGSESETVSFGSLQSCWVIGGIRMRNDEDGREFVWPNLLWCPDNDPEHRYIGMAFGRYHPDLTSFVRRAAVELTF